MTDFITQITNGGGGSAFANWWATVPATVPVSDRYIAECSVQTVIDTLDMSGRIINGDVIVRPAAGAGHDGTRGTGIQMGRGTGSGANLWICDCTGTGQMIVEDMEVRFGTSSNSSSSIVSPEDTNTPLVILRRCLVTNVNTLGNRPLSMSGDAQGSFHVISNRVWDESGLSTTRFFNVFMGAGILSPIDCVVQGNTFQSDSAIQRGLNFEMGNAAPAGCLMDFQGNMVFGTNEDYRGTDSGIGTTFIFQQNTSEDNTGQITGATVAADLVSVNNPDLKTGSIALEQWGNEPTGFGAEIDIRGFDRSVVAGSDIWDIGSMQFSSSAVGTVIPITGWESATEFNPPVIAGLAPTVIISSVGIGLDFTTWNAFLAAVPTDLVAAGEEWIGEGVNQVYNELINISGFTTDATHRIIMRPATGQESNTLGTFGPRIIPGTGVILVDLDVITIDNDNIVLEGLTVSAFAVNGTTDVSAGVHVLFPSRNVVLNGLVVFGIDISRSNRGIQFEGSGVVDNCFVWGILANTGNARCYALFLNDATYQIECLNNTGLGNSNILDVFQFQVGVTGGVIITKNNMGFVSSQTDFDYSNNGGTITTDKNLSGDDSADDNGDGTHFINQVLATTLVSSTVGLEDLHILTGGPAIGGGVDLGTTPDGVEIDIDGYDRELAAVAWDIGADQQGKTRADNGAAPGIPITGFEATTEYSVVDPGSIQLMMDALASQSFAQYNNPTIPGQGQPVVTPIAGWESVTESTDPLSVKVFQILGFETVPQFGRLIGSFFEADPFEVQLLKVLKRKHGL